MACEITRIDDAVLYVRMSGIMKLADQRSLHTAGMELIARDKVDEAYRDREQWTRISIFNVARMGRFSSDRAIREYCRDIWHADPVPVALV
jgi:glucan phosphorylase